MHWKCYPHQLTNSRVWERPTNQSASSNHSWSFQKFLHPTLRLASFFFLNSTFTRRLLSIPFGKVLSITVYLHLLILVGETSSLESWNGGWRNLLGHRDLKDLKRLALAVDSGRGKSPSESQCGQVAPGTALDFKSSCGSTFEAHGTRHQPTMKIFFHTDSSCTTSKW